MKAPPSYAAAMQTNEIVPTSSDNNMNPPSYTQAMTIQENTEATNTRQPRTEESSST